MDFNGFRAEIIVVATTLLDAEEITKSDLAQLKAVFFLTCSRGSWCFRRPMGSPTTGNGLPFTALVAAIPASSEFRPRTLFATAPDTFPATHRQCDRALPRTARESTRINLPTLFRAPGAT